MKHKEVVDGLHRSDVGMESNDETIETNWRFFRSPTWCFGRKTSSKFDVPARNRNDREPYRE